MQEKYFFIKKKTLLRNLVRFMINYQFYCKKCAINNQESFATKQACKDNFFLHLCHSYIKMIILLFKAFHQLCLTTLANLTADIRNENKSSKIFSKEDVINFIEKNWESMTTAPRRTRSTWHATVSRSMVFTTFTTLI